MATEPDMNAAVTVIRAVKLAQPGLDASSAAPSTAAGPARQKPDTFPRWVLLCAGGVIALSLISVGLVRITGNGPDQRPAAATQERELRFEDRPDGSIAVIDGRTGEMAANVQGEQGFVRGALRALARERKVRGLGAEQAFQLMVRTDGGLTLYDPATSQRVDLEAFGPSNAENFARLLKNPPALRPMPLPLNAPLNPPLLSLPAAPAQP
jgi:putative photosynthetic complex assembly protein